MRVAYEQRQGKEREETAISHEEAETESQEERKAVLHRGANREKGEGRRKRENEEESSTTCHNHFPWEANLAPQGVI